MENLKITEKQLTEKEKINLPKVTGKTIYLGKDTIYLKEKRDYIIELGKPELFKEINTTLNVNNGLTLMLYVALCGHEKVTSFKGDPDKAIEKIKKEHPSLDMYGEQFRDSLRNDVKEFYKRKANNDLSNWRYYRNRYSNSISSINNIKARLDDRINTLEKDIEEKEYSENLIKRFKEELKEKKSKVKESSNYILEVLSHIDFTYLKWEKYNLPSKIDLPKQEYYRELYKIIDQLLDHMTPQTSTNALHGLKVKYLRDEDSMNTEVVVDYMKSNINTKTGDMLIRIKDAYGHIDYEFNIYKDKLTEFTLADKVTFATIVNVISNKYLLYNELKKKVVLDTLTNKYNIAMERYYSFMDAGIYDDISNLIKLTPSSEKRKVNSKSFANYEHENYLEPIKSIVLMLDRIRNSGLSDMFGNLEDFVIVPEGKYKLHHLLGLDKQLFDKLKGYNQFEQKNFMRFKTLLAKELPQYHTPTHLNQLFEDDFLMVQDASSVTRAMYVGKHAYDSFDISFSTFRKIVKYLDVDVPNRQRISGYAISNFYTDFFRGLVTLVNKGYRTLESVNLTPFSLKLEHDVVTDEVRTIENKVNDEILEEAYKGKIDKILNKTYKWKDNQIDVETVFLPANSTELLKEEGRSLSHCVGGYTNSIVKGKCLILLARDKQDKDTSWFTVEIRLTDNGLVLGQQQSLKEYKLPNALQKQLVKDIKEINKEKHKEMMVA